MSQPDYSLIVHLLLVGFRLGLDVTVAVIHLGIQFSIIKFEVLLMV
jgi:hypothetical protein